VDDRKKYLSLQKNNYKIHFKNIVEVDFSFPLNWEISKNWLI